MKDVPIEVQGFDSAYAGSMFERKDGAYVLRDDPVSLAGALLELVKQKSYGVENLEGVRDSLLDAMRQYLHAQDELDNQETSGPNATPYSILMVRRNVERRYLDDVMRTWSKS